MPTIRIDNEVYLWLKTQAEPFEDTPNSVLRRIAGFDKKPIIVRDAPKNNNNKMSGGLGSMTATNPHPVLPKRLSGKYLARHWEVNVVHALYHKDGSWYNHLEDFPGALFDPNGYVLFNSEKEYKESPYLQHGIELHVINGISSMPGYKRVRV